MIDYKFLQMFVPSGDYQHYLNVAHRLSRYRDYKVIKLYREKELQRKQRRHDLLVRQTKPVFASLKILNGTGVEIDV